MKTPKSREQAQQTLNSLRDLFHADCIVCGRKNMTGIRLPFRVLRNGTVNAKFSGSKTLQGYQGLVHGGAIAAMLDGAMTNCLFAHGIKALTAELKIRFSKPVNTQGLIRLNAHIEKSYGNFHLLKAELFQDKILKAKATGKFMRYPEKIRKNNS